MRGLFTIIVVIVSFFILAAIAILISFIPGSQKFARNLERFWIWLSVKSSGLKIKTEGRGNVPKDRPVVFACNHSSQLDIPVLYFALPVPFCFLVKKELFKIPLFGKTLKQMGHIPVDRSGGKAAMKSLKKAAETLRKGTSIVVFPEGTRSADGRLQEFKPGVIMVALFAGAPIVPVAIKGTHEALPKGKLLIKPAPITVRIGKPVDTMLEGKRKDKHELTKEIEQKVAELLA